MPERAVRRAVGHPSFVVGALLVGALLLAAALSLAWRDEERPCGSTGARARHRAGEQAVIHADIIGERARLTPEKTALLWVPDGSRYTYRDLDQRAGRMAESWLGGCGFAPGDRVGLLAYNRVEFIDAFFAAARTGVILVLLGTKLTPHEIGFIANNAGLRGFVYASEFIETVRALAGATNVERWIALDDPAVPGHARIAGLLAEVAPRPGRARAPRPGPEDICCLLYTSGTTGKPKGVMVPTS